MKTALVVGATGVVGREILLQLLADERYDKVIVWARREIKISSAKLETRVIDFEKISELSLYGVDEVFCALGTTINQAKTRANFIKVDFTYTFEIAKVAKISGVQKFILISAPNANSTSKNFYLCTKGKVEDAIRGLRFKALHIVRAPLIDGKRAQFRLGEWIFIKLFKILPKGFLKTYQPLGGKQIAKAAILKAQDRSLGVCEYFVFEILG
ncbi:NAD(P)H-binding protein [Campylobacter suis]|uniref:NAD(P)-binding domain-containing protein n=1 Tax=Campylobacter suis TaxID=2790657 RepID=A0ABM8Q370_9BACT|nr:NAD(P)H-binding protein [Campylobacter suis]CAD7287208.1 hypothetical protein LMG8286_00839 [Campylobacter suis]